MKDSAQLPSPTKPRRRSSMSSFHSIDEFRATSNPLQALSGKNHFPIRPAINIFLILLTTIQVFLLVNSRIYLRGELIRTFLSVYISQDDYPDIFDGGQFYLSITNITELQNHFDYLFKRVNIIDNDSFVDFYYKDTKFLLHTEYKQFAGNEHRKNIHEINPKIGIVQPFNMRNITDMQLYLLQITSFQLEIQNLTMKENWYGFREKYSHQITYYFIDNIRVQVSFNFRINNAMVPSDKNTELNDRTQSRFRITSPNSQRNRLGMTDCIDGQCYYYKNDVKGDRDDQKKYQLTYIVRIRTFYGFVLILTLISLYLNYISIKRTYKILSQQLTLNKLQLEQQQSSQSPHYHHPLIGEQQQHEMRVNIRKWVQTNSMTVLEMKLEHYFHLLQFDLIFSTLSNIFGIVTAFYLVSGLEMERIAGLTCLFSWLTIFKFVRNYQKLVLMYQLIKLSFAKVTMFFVQFLPVFLSYALLGMCLFPKVSFFSSLADSVTTLVALMMGDSIQMITNAILQKNSIILGMTYMFTFVFLFMHAIHNTLTSLIKQFFILKKIELVKWEKQNKKQNNYIYIEQLRPSVQYQKQKLPLKLTSDLMRGILRVKALNRTKGFQQQITMLYHEIDNIRVGEKWMIQQDELSKFPIVKQQLIRRAMKINEILRKLNLQEEKKPKRRKNQRNYLSLNSSQDNKQSLLTQIDEKQRK